MCCALTEITNRPTYQTSFGGNRENIMSDMNTMRVKNSKDAMLDRSRWRRIVLAAKTHDSNATK